MGSLIERVKLALLIILCALSCVGCVGSASTSSPPTIPPEPSPYAGEPLVPTAVGESAGARLTVIRLVGSV